ncbi:MAG: GrpB family protein [Chloroflexota bacterium]
MSSIRVVEYDAAWPDIFERLRRRAWAVVGDFALSIEHVGSTSVPGLAAKPIVDMSVVVASEADVPRAIERLATIGYEHRGDLGVAGREAFYSPPHLPAHHLYVCPAGSLGLRNHLAVRDYLRANPGAAREYAALKQKLAARHPHDIEAYIDGKTGFILDILRQAGLAPEQLQSIADTNRQPPRNEPS